MITFEVDEMTCGHCVRSITQAVRSIDRDAGVQIDLASHRVAVESARLDAGALAQAIRAAGYTPVEVTSTSVAPAASAPRAGCCCR